MKKKMLESLGGNRTYESNLEWIYTQSNIANIILT
jgi:hypothetical protein